MSSDSVLDPNQNNAHMIYYPAAVFAGVCPLLVSVRTWARLRMGGKMNADDWTAWAALAFCLLTSAFLVIACHYGMGQHYDLIEPGDRFETLKFFYLAQITYKASINLTKCCILLLYLRIFQQIRWFKWACWMLICIIGLYCVASIIPTVFQCAPISRAFDKSIPGTCIDNIEFWFANAGFSISTDVVILLLPMPLVYQLQIPIGQKIALAGVFGLGVVVLIASCLRVTTFDILATSTDITYDIENMMWSIIEPNLAVICACLPMLRCFIGRVFPSLRSRWSCDPNHGQFGGAGTGRGYGTRFRVGAGTPTERAGTDWEETGGVKSNAVQMTSIRRSESMAGSKENILKKGTGRDGIQKRVDVTVQYSEK